MVQFILRKLNGKSRYSISVSNLQNWAWWVLGMYLRTKVVDGLSIWDISTLRLWNPSCWEPKWNRHIWIGNLQKCKPEYKWGIFKNSKVTKPKDTVPSLIIPNTLTKAMNFIVPKLFLKILCLLTIFFFLQTHVLVSEQIRSMGWGHWDRAYVHILITIFANTRHQLCSPQCPQISVSQNSRTASILSISQITHLYKELENFLLLTWGQKLFTRGRHRVHPPLYSLLSFQVLSISFRTSWTEKGRSHSTCVTVTDSVQLKKNLFLGLR